MQAIMQISPVAYAQPRLSAKWGVVNGMEIATEFADAATEQARKKLLGVTDVSCFQRYGVKGPQASQWLADHELAIPSRPNSWVICKRKSLVLRLGAGEFLIEDLFGGYACEDLTADTQRVAGVYQVPRADAAFILSGSEVLRLFSELCPLDLRNQALAADDVVMTQVAGVSATLLRQSLDDEQVYRLWCDGTYGPYMWEILMEIAGELGGGAVGLSSY
ncbi:MAG TPA: sarcosine oxidase subunit gamma [Methylophilaceae bacterium]|nr:sarcosine oxidase subunit gamma [Methylophilaceae bacterium]